MFENFTFEQRKVTLAEDGTDLEPRLSPKDVPVDWNSPLARPPTTRPTFSQDNHHSSESIDTLVQQMSRQTLLPYRRSDGSRAVRRIQEPDSNWAAVTSQTQMHPISLPHTWHRPSLAPTYPGGSSQAPPAQNLCSAPTGSPHSPADMSVSRTYLSPSPSPVMHPKTHGGPANPRAVREALLEIMITKGLQCKVQASAPLTPVSASEPTSPRIEALEAKESSDHLMSGADRPLEPLEPLEVDGKFGAKEEEAFLKSLVSLRQAATPGGIRRSSGLRFSSSAEMAAKTQNLKRNKIKMRKRDKGKSAKLPQAQEPMQMPTPPPEDAASPLASM